MEMAEAMTNSTPRNPPADVPASIVERGALLPVAITLIVLSVLWAFLLLCGIAFFWSRISDPDTEPETRHQFFSYMLYMLVCVAYSLMLVSGAFSMIRKGSYAWAIATSWLAMVPMLGPFYFLGIPVGTWALVALTRPRVREAFRSA